MKIATSLIQRSSLKLSRNNKLTNIVPIQYNMLAPKYSQPGSILVPHSYSNKYDPIKMTNTLKKLYEDYRIK